MTTTIIVTDGLFNNFEIIDEIEFKGNVYIYDARFGPTPGLRNPTDRNKLEEYFYEKKLKDVKIHLISFNRNDQAIINADKIYIFSTKEEKNFKIEFIKYIKTLTNIPVKYIFSQRKTYYNNNLTIKSMTPQTLFKEMGLNGHHSDKVNTNIKNRMKKIKKRAQSSKKKKSSKQRESSTKLEGSPFSTINT